LRHFSQKKELGVLSRGYGRKSKGFLTAFVEIMEKATSLALELLGLEGKGYKAIFLQVHRSSRWIFIALIIRAKIIIDDAIHIIKNST
jgi:hypothetical protein